MDPAELSRMAAPLSHAERVKLLDRFCGGDSQLRTSVESLLFDHDQQANTTEKSEASSVPQVGTPVTASWESAVGISGAKLVAGKYKLVQHLGEGGMGSVWLAEQDAPVKRQVFVLVCLAVQHAHQKGIIHRDIKPSNILVCLVDDQPVPKLIDFGLAKATGPALTEKTLHTGLHVVGTPQYMSPEQATFDHQDIDTRSDIYSLGVLLYELLAGVPPFTRRSMEQSGLAEFLRMIREEDPPRPSANLATAADLPRIAAQRRTEPSPLIGLLRRDLDWIAMKALEKDRARRSVF